MRWILLPILLLTARAALGSPVADGAAIYKDQCLRCHGATGQGSKKAPQPLIGEKSPAQLATVIARTMPEDDDEKCTAPDAQKVAAYVCEAFYSPDARARLDPPHVQLSHLTVRQYRNSVADLIGSFRSPQKGDDRHGLRAEYYTGRNFGNKGLLSRVDPEVKFDFGTAGPEGDSGKDKFNPNQFRIRWEGSVAAPESGVYEFVVKTEHALRLWVNDPQKPLIDAMVKSGPDTEFRAAIPLLAGRTYSIRLEFAKGSQLDNDKKMQAAKPTKASVELLWKLPHGFEEVIPARQLSPAKSSEVAVIAAPFPPDDRSLGWERGTIVSKEWDAATTDAALETAAYIAAHLPELSGVSNDAPDRGPKLRAFCRKFAERAFRCSLTEAEKQRYVDQPFDAVKDPETAVKRVVLRVLKSPRFLYPFALDDHDGYAVASHLALTLWDSTPDQALLDAAAGGKLSTRAQIDAQAERMLADPRAKVKVREFLLAWLKVDQSPELVKDPKRFPGFDAAVAADLRTSLELFLDDIVWSDTSDFRKLLWSDEYFLNPRLAEFYGVQLPDEYETDFMKMKLGAERAGVLTHPYLLSVLAYPAESSPIHRGVFIGRGLLGITLRPPPDAFTPFTADQHPGLTTRQRIALQTSPTACVGCHGIMNPLGFSLESFDAVGRYRNQENGKPLDLSGLYESREGPTIKFGGARQLAAYLAGSDEVHTAFAQQMFHYFVKQPVRAYGLKTPRELPKAFAESAYNIRKLVVEIAVIASQPAGR